ncbi:unnamed protein product, partial [Scytosiphon promiscuus]
VGVRAAAGFPVGSEGCGSRSDSAGGGSGDRRKSDVVPRLTALEARLRRGIFAQPLSSSPGNTGKNRQPGVAVAGRDPAHAPKASGDGAVGRAGDEHGQRSGGGSGVPSNPAEEGWWCSEGMAGIRRAARAVRALVEAGTGAAADRDRVKAELTGAQAELQSALDRLESSRTEVARLGRALEEACAARSALLPRLRDSQVSKEALEAVADRASSELADARDFLHEVAGVLARSGGGGGSSSEAFTGDGDAFSPGWTSTNTNTNTDADSSTPVPQGERREGRAGVPTAAAPAVGRRSGSSSARLISAVAAGVQGLLAERATTADALCELDRRCSRARKEVEEMKCADQARDAAHREQLVELRKWCENEVEAQRRAKKAGQAAADCALRDLSSASKKVSALEKEGSRLRKRLAAANLQVSSLAEEACAAKAGLRLLARACAPLLERCRVLAAQKRLLTRWYGPSTTAVVAAAVAAAERGGIGSALCPGAGRGGGGRGGPEVEGAVVQPNAVLLVDGLRTLVSALSAEGRQRERGPDCCNERETRGGNNGGGAEHPTGRSNCFHGQTQQQQQKQEEQEQQQQERPLVSLRAVAIAAVAVERLKRLGAVRAARRASARAAAAAAAAAAAVNDGVESDTPLAAPPPKTTTPGAVNAGIVGGGGG